MTLRAILEAACFRYSQRNVNTIEALDQALSDIKTKIISELKPNYNDQDFCERCEKHITDCCCDDVSKKIKAIE